jgi:adenylate cyclase class IV
MRIQQKFKLTIRRHDELSNQLRELGAKFSYSSLTRDIVFQPDTRAYRNDFIERFPLKENTKGLFLRLREENNLTTGKGMQQLIMEAFAVHQLYLISDIVHVRFFPEESKLADILKILDVLGVDKVVEITKKREAFRLVYNTFTLDLHLDQVEGIDEQFVEITSFIEKDERDFYISTSLQFLDEIKLAPQKAITTPYAHMVLQKT